MPRISASVVMYGSPEETLNCIKSLCAHTKDSCIYLVDNASPDDALKKLCENEPPKEVVVLPQKQNKGYGSGHNVVLPLLNSRYHAVVNPDILLNDDALNAMADWMDKNPDVVITTPHLVFPNGQEQLLAKRRPALLPLLARQFSLKFLKKYERHYLMQDEDLAKPTDVQFCSGSFFLIRTNVFKKMGGFDEKYFMYVEDADITQKALRFGRAVYLPHVTVVHEWQRKAHGNMRQFVWQAKSMFRYFCKWGFKLK